MRWNGSFISQSSARCSSLTQKQKQFIFLCISLGVINMSNNNESYLAVSWKVTQQIMFLPKFVCFGIPLLIFVSLFFIPEGYASTINGTEAMKSDSQNKWLFDILYINAVIIFVYSQLNCRFNKQYRDNKHKIAYFFITSDPIASENSIKTFIIMFYGIFILHSMIAFIVYDGFNNTGRMISMFANGMFVNYFLYVPTAHFIYVFFGFFLCMSKDDMRKGLKYFSNKDDQ